MNVPLLLTVREWYCPNCTVADQTQEARPHTRFHACAGLSGLTAPMLEVGTRAKVYRRDREDYAGNSILARDAEGRPVMSVVTERDDGTSDCIVFAPTAVAKVS